MKSFALTLTALHAALVVAVATAAHPSTETIPNATAAAPVSSEASCTGSSASLLSADCAAWQGWFDGANGQFWDRCNTTRTDPCACNALVGCLNGQITSIDFQNIPGVFGDVSPLIKNMKGLRTLVISGNQVRVTAHTHPVPTHTNTPWVYCS
jgi:hypothetical protein